MYQISLRWLIDILSGLFSSQQPIPHPTEISPLSSSEYETLLIQILEGVTQGWQQPQLWQRLDIRLHDPWFVSWLQRYGKNILRQSPEQIDREFAQRLIQLGVIGCGDLGDVATSLGRRLLELSNRTLQSSSPRRETVVTTIDSDNPLELFHYGMDLYQKGEFEGALTLWETAIEQDQSLREAYNACGVVLFNLGRFEAAIAHFDELLRQEPDYLTALFNRGIVYLETHNIEAAIADFNSVLELDSTFHSAYAAQGIACQYQQQWQDSLEQFNQALHLEPNNYWAYNGRGHAYVVLQNYADALTDFSEALVLEPNCTEAYHNRGNVYTHLGQNQAALEDFTQAILIEPNFYPAYYSRGNLYLELGQYAKAVADYQQALSLHPNYLHAYNSRGIALTSLGRYTEAIADFNRLLSQDPQCWQAWANRGWSMYQAPSPLGPQAAIKNWQDGLQELAKQPQSSPLAISTLYNYLGLAWTKQAPQQADPPAALNIAIQHYQKALDALQDIVGLEVAYLTVLEDLIVLYLRLGNVMNGKNYLNIALLILNQLLLNCEQPTQKLQLMNQFQGLYQLKVDQLAQSQNPRHHPQALELAEERNTIMLNVHLDSQWNGTTGPTLTYGQMQRLLDEQTAIVYWHLSPTSITLFLLLKSKPPIILTSGYDQRQILQGTWQQWESTYQLREQSHVAPNEQRQWRSQLPQQLANLFTQLGVEPLIERLPEEITRLILVPHKMLVALPIASLFAPPFTERALTVSQLPALQWAAGLEFTPTLPPTSDPHPPLLAIDSPSGLLPHAELEVAAIAQFFAHHHLERAEATAIRLLGQLQRPFNIFHFAGEGILNLDHPLYSHLQLAQETSIKASDLLEPTYSSPPLVCLSGTAVRETVLLAKGESFLGLPAVFLNKGASYVLVSLWSVPEVSTALLMGQFYAQVAQSIPPAQALQLAQQWLRQVSYQGILQVYADWQTQCRNAPPRALHNLEVSANLMRDKASRKGEMACPYEHPYYWAGFTIVGKVH